MAGRNSRRFRDLDGVLLLDKPLGISSNQALQKARHLFQAAKAGHTGSLDPLASGMLPICFGEATKFSSYLLEANKRYRAVCRLGMTTTTGDLEGEVLEQSAVPVSINTHEIDQVLCAFRGVIEQIPPMFSAVKHDGKRLYELARQGKEVVRKSRQVEIFELQLVSCHDQRLEIDVLCSKGTYIRTLAEDIGKSLGCGACLQSLRRTAVSPFTTEKYWTLEQLQQCREAGVDELDRNLLPIDAMLQNYPAFELPLAECREMAFGRQVVADGAQRSGVYRLFNPALGFLGLGEFSSEGQLTARRLRDTNRLLERLSAVQNSQ